jgi:ubiquinone/menaquinone biosynthesis C-methylase UbiE
MLQFQRLIEKSLRAFFYLLYHPFAWSYDLVAATVSVGRWYTWTQTILDDIQGQRILELGHGPGHLLGQISASFVVGLDRSQQMSQLARRSNPAANLVHADGALLPFAPGSFDQIIATFPTEYIVQPGTLEGIRRILAVNGEFILLPIAWIESDGVLDRIMKFAFRLTGQTPPKDSDFAPWQHRLEAAGFAVHIEYRSLKDSSVLVVKARKA